MELFPGLRCTEKSGRFQVETPLGIVRSFVSINGVELPLEEAKLFGVGFDGLGAQWRQPQCHAEAVLLRPVNPFREMYPVAECRAFLWRVRLIQPVASLHFSCRLHANQLLESGPDSGQFLDAQTWETENIRVTIGTHDDVILSSLAGKGDMLPPRYETPRPWPWEYLFVAYLPDGFNVTFTDAEASDEFQIHFAVAWSFDDKEAVATWYAVDTDAERILAGVG